MQTREISLREIPKLEILIDAALMTWRQKAPESPARRMASLFFALIGRLAEMDI